MGYLREAGRNDLDLLFRWANERAVRKSAFSEHEIAYDEHVKWFENVLKCENVKQYIFIHDNEPVGQIRADIHGNEAFVSYSICMEKRCMGYGKEMVGLLKGQVKRDFPQVKKMIANVKPDNIASQKVFLDSGYHYKCNVYEIEMTQENIKFENQEICTGGGIVNNK